MSRKQALSRGRPGDLTDAVGPDDGLDPKAFHDRRTRGKPGTRHAGCKEPGRKVRQLCGQVRDALHGVLAGCADGVLRELVVVSVDPAPHAGRLMVTVAVSEPADATDRATAAEHLDRAVGLLRREVASAVHRRRAPELTFRVR